MKESQIVKIIRILFILVFIVTVFSVQDSYAESVSATSSKTCKLKGTMEYTFSCGDTSCTASLTGKSSCNSDCGITAYGHFSATNQSDTGKTTFTLKNGSCSTKKTGSYTWQKSTSAYSITVTWNLIAKTSTYGSAKPSFTKTVPALASYAIGFNANGGSGNTDGKTKYHGQAIMLNAAPSRTGYTFAGWKWNNSGTSYDASESWNGANSAGTFYAQWTPNTYTIHYNSNTGSGSMEDSTFTYDQDESFSSVVFTKSGYRFMGWNRSSDASDTWYRDDSTVKNLSTSEPITVYAQWCKTSKGVIKINNVEKKDSYGNYVFTNKAVS